MIPVRAGLLKTISLLAIAVICVSGALVMASSEDSEGAALYTVTFDGNGGRTDMNESSVSYSVIGGQDYQLHVSLFERDGYYLSGWKSGSTTYDPGEDVTISRNMTFTAQWEQGNGTFDKVYDATDGQTFTMTPFDGQEIENDAWGFFQIYFIEYGIGVVSYQGEIIEVSMPSWLKYTISQEKITFSGKPSGPGMYYVELVIQSTGLYDRIVEDTRVSFAIAVSSDSDDMKTVTFQMNGGTGSVDSVTGPIGSAFVLPNYTDSDGDMISKNGETLVGWRMYDGAGSYSIYPLGSLYTIRFDNTATAYWVDDPNVLVYSMDGGSLENVEAYVTQDGDSITLASKGAVKDGYTFLGWRPSQDHDVAYAPGLVMSVEGSMYMVAYFVEDGTALRTVTYDANGGQGVISSQKVESGMYVRLPSSMNFVKEGFTFIGWSEDQGGEPLTNLDYRVTSDVILYAVWEENGSGENPDEPDPQQTYRVVFDPNGGSESYGIQNVQSGGLAVRPYDPTRDGYVFMGWRSLTDSENWDFGFDAVTTDIILQAQWSQHFTITVSGSTVTVNLVGDWYDMSADIYWDDISDRGASTSIGPSVGSASHDYSDGQTSWTSYGYIVVTSTDSTGSYTSRMPYSVQGEHFNPSNEYTVTFEPMNGDAAFTQTVLVGDTATMPEAPVWQGHVFSGWYYLGAEWNFDTIVTCDMTLVASWDDEVPDDPDTPTIITPVASGRITEVDGGWRLDGTSSTNAVSWEWFLDGASIGSGTSMILSSDSVSDGTHKIVLKVTSSSGHTGTWDGEIIAKGGDDAGAGGWIEENWVLVLCITIVVIVLLIAVARYL